MHYVHRLVEESILKTLSNNKIAVLYGPRQVGKTTLALRVAEVIDREYKYLSCDEPDVALALSDKSSTELAQYIGNNKMLVIDEAQRVKNIGTTLKLLANNYPDIRIIATGSASFELANSTDEPLTGKANFFNIWPLALNEVTSDKIEQSRLLNDLLLRGSYPLVALRGLKDVDKYLGNLTKNYLYKDLLSYGLIRSEATLIALLKALALQIGSEVSLSELSRLLQVEVATVKRLLNLLEKAFVIHRLKPLASEPRTSVKNTSKIYFTDLGVRNYLIGNFNPMELRTDGKALWENFCVNELRKIKSISSEPVNTYFWRNYANAEVNYIEEIKGELTPYKFICGSKKPRLPKAFQDNLTSQNLKVISRENFQILT